jgi:PTS system nitrogen regulatory IIA component
VSQISSFLNALGLGNVVNNVKGSKPEDILQTFIKVLHLPKHIDKASLGDDLVERESLGSTAIGYGYAMPHPRKRIMNDEHAAIIAVAYLENPVEWSSPDGRPVEVLFLLLSGEDRQHLTFISEIASIVNDLGFREFMTKKPQKDKIIEYLSERYLLNPKATR